LPIFVSPQSSSQPNYAPGIAYRTPLLSGEQGTAQTVQLMRQLIDEALADSQFIRFVTDLVRSVPAYDDLAEAQALYGWVKRNIRFTKDPLTKEKLYPPQELLKIKAGDCDDISMLLGAMLLAVGYPARLITISADESNPQEFSHVYPEAEVPPGSGNWIAMDAARLDSSFGSEPPAYFRKRAWSLTDDSYQDIAGATRLRGLGSYGSVGQFPGPLPPDPSLYTPPTPSWSDVFAQGISEIPSIISAATGQPYNPYASFQTPYTPGATVPRAGYSPYAVPSATSLWLSQNWPWLVGLGLLAVIAKRGA
jgi:Transglutaminase-like superfamily